MSNKQDQPRDPRHLPSDPDQIRAALECRDWFDAEVDTSEAPSDTRVIHSASMSLQLTARLFAEAERRGITPHDLICQYVEAGLDAAGATTPAWAA